MVKHHTLNVYPSYVERDFLIFGIKDLHWQVPPVNGFIPPEHGIGFAALVAPLCWALPRGKQKLPIGLYECADLPAMNRGIYNFDLQWSADWSEGNEESCWI